MRRLLAWISGAAGGILAYRLLRRRSRRETTPPPVAGPDPRAEELRVKLEQAEPAADAHPAAEPEPEPEPEPAGDADPDARRRLVHDAARATVDEMRRPPES